MKKYGLLLCLLLISTAVAQEDLFYQDHLKLEVILDSGFTLTKTSSKASVDYVVAKVSLFPMENYNQEIISLWPTPDATLVDDVYVFTWDNPSFGFYPYRLESKVNTYNKFNPIKSKIHFPLTKIDQDVEIYLAATDKIDINRDIIRTANEIAEGHDDLFVVVSELALWTKKNINYTLNTLTAEASQKASWVLDNGYGVCDEITTLFIALARSLNIPARFVSGISYTNSDIFSEEWGLHGWAEVYFPGYGWVAFDPTYGQFGNIDATHIKLRDSLDSDKSTVKFEWQSIDVDLSPEKLKSSIVILEEGSIPSMVSMDIKTHSNEIGFGSFNLVELTVQNLKDYYIAFETSLSSSKDVWINEKDKFVVLKPKSEKKVYWIVSIPADLNPRYIYTFPLHITTSLGNDKDYSFKSTSKAVTYTYNQINNFLDNLALTELKTLSKDLKVSCKAPKNIFAGEDFSVNCSFTNTGNIFLEDIKVCASTICSWVDIGIGETKNVLFSQQATSPGEQETVVTARSPDINAYDIARYIVEDYPKITIDNLNYPAELKYGDKFSVFFELWKHSASKPRNLKIDFEMNGDVTSWNLEDLESNQGFEVHLDKDILVAKDNKFIITVRYQDTLGRDYSEQIEKPIEIGKLNFLNKLEIYLNTFNRWLNRVLAKIY